MSVITEEDLDKLKRWIAGMSDEDLERYIDLTELPCPSRRMRDRKTWVRLGILLLREQCERERRREERGR